MLKNVKGLDPVWSTVCISEWKASLLSDILVLNKTEVSVVCLLIRLSCGWREASPPQSQRLTFGSSNSNTVMLFLCQWLFCKGTDDTILPNSTWVEVCLGAPEKLYLTHLKGPKTWHTLFLPSGLWLVLCENIKLEPSTVISCPCGDKQEDESQHLKMAKLKDGNILSHWGSGEPLK